jgi:hypothetical protein
MISTRGLAYQYLGGELLAFTDRLFNHMGPSIAPLINQRR